MFGSCGGLRDAFHEFLRFDTARSGCATKNASFLRAFGRGEDLLRVFGLRSIVRQGYFY